MTEARREQLRSIYLALWTLDIGSEPTMEARDMVRCPPLVWDEERFLNAIQSHAERLSAKAGR